MSNEIKHCRRCGADGADAGTLHTDAIRSGIRFQSDNIGFLGRMDAVKAVACRNCGHIELRLAVMEGADDQSAAAE